MLAQIAILLAAAVFVVPLFRKLKLGAVLGYLAAGVLIGPWCLRLITDVGSILHFSEFGVVLLLFIIGLELQPSRLWVLRRSVFGLGSAQVLITAVIIGALALPAGQHWRVGIVIGFGLAMSSTAFILQTLAERDELTTRHGREAFAILLFQDLAVIPLLALLPLLAPDGGAGVQGGWAEAGRAIVIIAAMLAIGRQVLRGLFRLVARFGNRELFTAAALLVVIATALLMNRIGLSMSLGAFLSGVLLADSEFRHEIEADLEPFKGLLLGLFFIAVGMSVNLGLIREQPLWLFGLAAAMILVKFAVLYAISRRAGGDNATARHLAVALAPGGEFAFVLFQVASSRGIIDAGMEQSLVVAVTLSMMLAPLLYALQDRWLEPWLTQSAEPEYDRIDEPGNPVVIAGFGRFGQITARILRMRGIPFTALESSPTQIDFVRRFGSKIYYGDASRLDLLRAAKVEQAKLFLLAIDNVEASLKVAEVMRRHFPQVPIYARARNRFHSYKLMDLDVAVLYRDTYLSSLEMARAVLQGLGIPPAEAGRTVTMFREYDEALLLRQHAIYQDEAALIQSVKQAADELKNLFESDPTTPANGTDPRP
ncbi:MAG TPA: monovalent cation:proton antiporter-2 (CPA2) family protein [Gammaproteobacteria bacterium]|nr:monovalent cation:proton antiporter-2 (CPA2) family protein [Gammaproteobacteria bacterium]